LRLFAIAANIAPRMPIGGGPVTTLVPAANMTHIRPGPDTVGPSLRSVPLAGRPSVALEATRSTVTALFVLPSIKRSRYFWGEPMAR
jgi:hypothetical protein